MRAAAAAFAQGFRKSSSSSELLNPETTVIDSRELILPPGRQKSDKEINAQYTVGDKIGIGSSSEVWKADEVESGEVKSCESRSDGLRRYSLIHRCLGVGTFNRNVLIATSLFIPHAIDTISHATRHHLSQPCALKIVSRKKFNGEIISQLRNEATVCAGFEMQPHPNLCMPFKFHETRTRVVFEMDLVEGGDLLEFLMQTPSLKWLDTMQAARLLVQIFRGVEFLHRNRVVHGDLKAENILLTRVVQGKLRPGDVTACAPGCLYKVCDFGNAVVLPVGEDRVILGEQHGTWGYASPEAWAGEGIGFDSDVWSLGVLAYVVMVGELPFDQGDETGRESFYANPKNFFKMLPKWKRISRGMRKLIGGMVKADRGKRMSMNEVLEAECFPGRSKAGLGVGAGSEGRRYSFGRLDEDD